MFQLIVECKSFFEIDFNEADALYYSHIYTFALFSDMIIRFCYSN